MINNKILKFYLLFLVIQIQLFADKGDFEKVSLQLQWKHQFQFAGFYIAKEKGFYKEVGLDVEINEFKCDTDSVSEVTSNQATYGIGRSNLIIHKTKGKKIKLLSAIFQSSPLVLIALPNIGINSLKDLKGKTLMVAPDESTTASLNAMLSSQGLTKNDMRIIDYSFNLDDLINRKVDITSGYISAQPYRLKQQGFEPLIFDPKDYGFDFYNDILFTSDDEVNNHPNRVKQFNEASLKGWTYAFEHIDEAADLILNKYNSQNKTKDELRYEAQALKKLAYYKTDKIGTLSQQKIEKIYDIYNILGLVKQRIDIKKFIFIPKADTLKLTQDERLYLQNKKTIKMCNNLAYEPIEFAFNGNQNDMRGISIDTLKLIEQQLNIKFENVETKSWKESQQFLKEKQCDILPSAVKNIKRLEYANFTKPYLHFPLTILTHKDTGFVSSLDDMAGKTMSRHKGSALIKIIEKEYPSIKIVETNDAKESFQALNSKKVDFTIATIPIISSVTSNYMLEDIHIAGYSNMTYNLGIAVRDDDLVLLNILNKSLSNISTQQHKDIYNKWVNPIMKVKVKVVDYTLLWQLLSMIVLIVTGFIYNQVSLKKLNRKLNTEVENKTKDLQLINQNLEQLVDEKTKKLLQSEETFRVLFDIAPIFIDSFDKDGKCVLWNNECEKVFGWSIEDINNSSNPLELFYPDPKVQKEAIDTIITKPEKVFRQWYPLNKQGEELTTMWAHIYLPNGEVINVGYDITNLKHKEELFVQQSKLASMGEMIGNIAHQWRQPLSIISTAASGMQIQKEHGLLTDTIFEESCDLIDTNAQYLSKTIDDFRDFIKGDTTIVNFKLKNDNDSFLKLINSTIKTYHIYVLLELEEDINIKGYPNQLIQCFINIFNNAKDALVENNEESNRYILIKQKVINDSVQIIFQDNAGGIPDDIINKVFDPYFTTKHQSQGTGLGLHMTYNLIVNSMNGTLKVNNKEFSLENTKCYGAEFIITIPLNSEDNKC